MNNITNTKSLNIVTGFWNFIPNRPEGMYLDNMKNILLLNHNITVFVPKKYEFYRPIYIEDCQIMTDQKSLFECIVFVVKLQGLL